MSYTFMLIILSTLTGCSLDQNYTEASFEKEEEKVVDPPADLDENQERVRIYDDPVFD